MISAVIVFEFREERGKGMYQSRNRQSKPQTSKFCSQSDLHWPKGMIDQTNHPKRKIQHVFARLKKESLSQHASAHTCCFQFNLPDRKRKVVSASQTRESKVGSKSMKNGDVDHTCRASSGVPRVLISAYVCDLCSLSSSSDLDFCLEKIRT
jgi:hypothetical protein